MPWWKRRREERTAHEIGQTLEVRKRRRAGIGNGMAFSVQG
jgi:hypothetical protein